MSKLENDSISENYINVIYAENVKPFTSYPFIFTKYPFNNFKHNINQ